MLKKTADSPNAATPRAQAPTPVEIALAALGRPLKAWSLIVTIYGDAVVPRGGALWLGSLLMIMSRFGVGEGVVRTAVSRLTSDGWLARTRRGRNSHYRLTPTARTESERASVRIYGGGRADGAWDGRWHTAVLLDVDGCDRQAWRQTLAQAGYGRLASTVMIAPASRAIDVPPPAIAVEMRTGAIESDRRIVASAWRLSDLAQSYQRLSAALATVEAAIARAPPVDGLEALSLRLLIIHALRRVVLHDPGLPAELLPADWPGHEARARAGRMWHALVPASEAWLTAEGRGPDGALPVGTRALREPFDC